MPGLGSARRARVQTALFYLLEFPLSLYHSLKWRSYQVLFPQPASPNALFLLTPKMTHTLCFNGGADLKHSSDTPLGFKRQKKKKNKTIKTHIQHQHWVRTLVFPFNSGHKCERKRSARFRVFALWGSSFYRCGWTLKVETADSDRQRDRSADTDFKYAINGQPTCGSI